MFFSPHDLFTPFSSPIFLSIFTVGVDFIQSGFLSIKHETLKSLHTGTGKTTIITHRLLHKERDFMTYSDLPGGAKEGLRQAIITTSPRLCMAIKKTVTKCRK